MSLRQKGLMVETVFCLHGTLHVIKARLSTSEVRSTGGPVYPQLIFPFQFETVPQRNPKELWILAIRAHLSTRTLGKIGTATPTNMPFRFGNLSSPSNFSATIEVPLDLYRAQKIEEGRKDSMELILDCWLDYLAISDTAQRAQEGLVEIRKSHPMADPLELYTMHQRINITVPQSEWIKNILPGFGCDSTRLIEITLPEPATNPLFEQSILALENAQRHFKRGLYDETASQCRIALDPFFEPVQKPDGSGTMPVLKKNWELRLGEAAHKWLDASSSAIKRATNSVHHSPTARFDQFEAQMLLMITTTLVSYAARSLKSTESV